LKRFILKAAIVSALACCSCPAGAQSLVKIHGYVFSDRGERLAGANVVVLGTGLGAATDAAGYFEIENLFVGEYDLEARFLGYRAATKRGVVVNQDVVSTVHFRLEPAAILLPHVVVEGKRVAASEDLSVQVITREAIERSTASSVVEILIYASGVDVLEEGGGSTRKRISIRGSNPNQVLVLLDGVRLNDPLTGEADLNQIPISMVEEIRISKGTGSQRFGSGALGGVIEIISRRHSVDEIRVGTTFGSYDAFGIRPAAAGGFHQIRYFLNFEHRNESGDYPYSYRRLDGSTVHEDRLNADFSSNNYFARLDFEHGRHAVQIQANVFNSHRGLPGLVFAWTPFANADTERRIVLGRYALNHKNWAVAAQVSRHSNESEFRNAPPADAPLRFRTVPPYHNLYKVTTHRAVVDASMKTGSGHRFQAQANLQRDDFSDRDVLAGSVGPVRNTDNLSTGLVLEGEWQLPRPALLTSVSLNHAFRFDYFSFDNEQGSREDFEFSPRFGLRLSRFDGWLATLQASWGQSFRVPTFADLFYQDFRVRGNPNLEPETGTEIEVALHTGFPMLGWLELSGSYFRKDVDNLIVWELGSFATWQPANTDARLEGLELGASWRLFGDRLHVTIDHVFLDAVDRSGRRTTNNKQLTYRPAQTTKIGLLLNLNFFSVDYRKRMVGERFTTASNTVRLPGYTVDDLTLAVEWRIFSVQANFKLSVFNLFDEDYQIVRRAPMPGRNWRAGIGFTF